MALRFETPEPQNHEFSSHMAWRGRRFLLQDGIQGIFCMAYCSNNSKELHLWLNTHKYFKYFFFFRKM
jgi:hypothetical protein